MRNSPLFADWPFMSYLVIYTLIIISVPILWFWKAQGKRHGKEIKVGIVAGHIPQDKKWDAKFQREVIDIYKRLSLSVSANSPISLVCLKQQCLSYLAMTITLLRILSHFRNSLHSSAFRKHACKGRDTCPTATFCFTRRNILSTMTRSISCPMVKLSL